MGKAMRVPTSADAAYGTSPVALIDPLAFAAPPPVSLRKEALLRCLEGCREHSSEIPGSSAAVET